MATKQPKDKYYLRSIHEEIGLYDRKLAHLLKYDQFATDKDREVAAQKLTSKRNLLVRDANHLIESGIEYKTSDVPRSLLTPDQIAAEAAVSAAEQPVAAAAAPEAQAHTGDSPVREVTPSFQKEIQEYLAKRRTRGDGSAGRKSA